MDFCADKGVKPIKYFFLSLFNKSFHKTGSFSSFPNPKTDAPLNNDGYVTFPTLLLYLIITPECDRTIPDQLLTRLGVQW